MQRGKELNFRYSFFLVNGLFKERYMTNWSRGEGLSSMEISKNVEHIIP